VHELAGRCASLREAIAEEGIEIGVASGAEVSLVWALEASHKQLGLASYGRRGGDLLIETPSINVAGAEALLDEPRGRARQRSNVNGGKLALQRRARALDIRSWPSLSARADRVRKQGQPLIGANRYRTRRRCSKLTRYLKKCRIIGLVGLVSFVLSMLPAAPAGAKLVCPPGTHNPSYCKRVLSLSVVITIQGPTVTVVITVTDPHVKVTLKHNGKVKTLFNRNATGEVTIKFAKPTAPGIYRVKAVATANGLTKTVVKQFTIS